MRSSALVLFTCAGLLLSGSAILGGSTSWMLLRISYYFWTTDLGVELASSILFIAGAIVCLPVCWLSILLPYNSRSLPLMITLLSLVIATLVLFSSGMSSIVGLPRAVREPSMLNTSMQRALYLDAVDPSVKSALAAMQLEDDHCHSPTYYTGCLRPALNELRGYTNSLAALGCAIIIVLAVTLFVTAYILVTNVVRKAVLKYQQPIRITCIPPPLGSTTTTYPNPPSVPI